MLKKFLEGIAFGSGFTLSFIVLWLLTSYLYIPKLASSALEQSGMTPFPSIESESPPFGALYLPPSTAQFHNLSIEEQIQRSSVTALAKHEPSSDGQLKAIRGIIFRCGNRREAAYPFG